MHKKKQTLIEGPIGPTLIADSIAQHSTKTNIGAHSIFLGQVRNDAIEGKTVEAIEYSCYAEMAEEQFHLIREETFAKYDLICMEVYHSTGRVEKGEICLFVFTSSAHRQAATEACSYVVERIKKEVPIWGKEIFEGESYQWKVNQPKTTNA